MGTQWDHFLSVVKILALRYNNNQGRLISTLVIFLECIFVIIELE